MKAARATVVPDLSIDVDDLGEVLRQVNAAGLVVEYGPNDEPLGAIASMCDAFDRLINVLAHHDHEAD